jgi:hypothetical protein
MGSFDFDTCWGEMKPSGFYVYLHRRGVGGDVFYVGKGSGNRAWNGRQRNAHWERVARKCGVSVEVVSDGLTEVCAYTLEKIMINIIGSDTLCNKTTGGQNPTNISSDDYIYKMRAIKSKPVVNNEGMIFDSQLEAAEWLRDNGWPRAATGPISNCVNGDANTAYGYIWWSAKNKPKKIKMPCDTVKSRHIKVIECCNGKIFLGYKEAVKWLVSEGIVTANKSMLSSCCRGVSKTAYGHKWRFVD